jgi:hypothetical protein
VTFVYTPPEVTTDPAVLAANAKALLEAELPGWRSSPGSIEDLLIDAFSFPAGEQAEVLVTQLNAQFQSLGPLVSLSPNEAKAATSVATITFTGTAGYTLAAGELVVGVRDANGELQGFRNEGAITVAAGLSTITATLTAEEPGSAANGLSGIAELVNAPSFVSKVELATSGEGIEAESEEEYLDRLAEQFAILKPGPVQAADAATYARGIQGVYRVTAVNLLKPAAADGGEGVEETAVEKCCTLAGTDALGAAWSAAVKTKVKEALETLREPNFRWFVVNPHFRKISVTATAYAWPGENLTTVKEAIEAALKGFLNPATWATDRTGRPQRWANDPVVRQSELYKAVAAVPGVRYVESLTFAKQGEALGTANVTIEPASKVPALPEPGVLTITVNATT